MRARLVVALAAVLVLFAPLRLPAAPLPAAPGTPPTEPIRTLTTGNALPPNGTVTITVPVHVKGIPAFYSGAYVYCSFRYVGQTPSPNASVGTGTESAQSRIAPLVNGAFDGNLTVTIKQQTTAPAQINGYWCQFLTADQGGSAPPPIVPQSGAPYTPIVQGSF